MQVIVTGWSGLTARAPRHARNHSATECIRDLVVEAVGAQGEISVGGFSDCLDRGGV